MKRILLLIVLIVTISSTSLFSQTIPDRQAIVDSLTNIDPAIKKYFPRWKICEPDLLIQIYQAFVYHKYDEKLLNQQDIEILAAPKEFPDEAYDILIISCGQASMNAVQIESNLGDIMVGFLSGANYYSGPLRGNLKDFPERDYCYTEIPQEVPLKPDQTYAIIDFLQPNNTTHAFTLSVFEQAIKLGNTGFWIRNKVGTDEIGYHFWSAGEAKVILQRPLYLNKDANTNQTIPYLINAYLGGGYRLTNGVNVDDNDLLGWVEERGLNSVINGKIVAGLDFHLPQKPEFGISMNVEVPIEGVQTDNVDITSFAIQEDVNRNVEFAPTNPNRGQYDILGVAPILRTTSQLSAFYHLWLNRDTNPENYFKFNLGASYMEVLEYAYYTDPGVSPQFLSREGMLGLRDYRPDEFADWLYAKIEYRNQAVFPFGASVQYSNQMFLGRIYIPLFGNWFYLEGKYSTPLRGVRPFEIENFFMVSPVIRLTI